jgi:hypothetical protein
VPFDHYLPASYIARFSEDRSEPKRSRRVWVFDKRRAAVFSTPAANICGARDFYTLEAAYARPRARFIDDLWRVYEPRLGTAIDALIDGSIDAHTWTGVMVNFVAALLVRGPDFSYRFQSRLAWVASSIPRALSSSHTNYARLMELQRLRAPVIGADWVVLTTTGSNSQTTCDLGYTGFVHVESGRRGMAVPLGPHHLLLVIPALKRTVAVARGGKWWPVIRYGILADEQHLGFLETLARNAQRFVIGPTERAVGRHRISGIWTPRVPEPPAHGFFRGDMARRYEHTYLRLVAALRRTPRSDEECLYVDYKATA